MEKLPAGLELLKQYPQFILWTHEDGTKVPIDPKTRYKCSPVDRSKWVSADAAVALSNATGMGVAFVLSDDDPFFFIDVDKALINNQWNAQAIEAVNYFPNAYVEVSQSNTGLHVLGATANKTEHTCKNQSLGLELYTTDRFIALTGTSEQGDINTDHTARLDNYIAKYFHKEIVEGGELAGWTNTPVDGYGGTEDDTDLIIRMMNSRSGASILGGKASIRELWEANPEVLADYYPSGSGKPFDHSSADMALCQHLAFWTGKNCERMDRLFKLSGLNRDKWQRQDYKHNTIINAVQNCKSVLQVKPSKELEPVEAVQHDLQATGDKSGLQYMTAQQQVEYFKGCVYILGLHRVLIPSGMLLKPEQFKAFYGGYLFALDSINDKTTKNAWEVFTESQAYNFPKVDHTCFRPELPVGQIVNDEGYKKVNTYVPIDVSVRVGDPSMFLDLLRRMLPDDNDRAILLAYMAACVQYKGVKFQWAPLIQGAEGNGKTAIVRVLERALGSRYTHLPNAADLGGNGLKYNSWVRNKLFIAVEEIYVSDRREVTEALKPYITNDRIEIQGKGVDQYTDDNRTNWVLLTNHKDALPVTINNRRYSIFYCAQQTLDDLIKYGMNEQYFRTLYDWLRTEGYEIMSNYLLTYPIPDALNPATTLQRAPKTTSLQEAITLSLGRIEQEVLEAIGEEIAGFTGGWVSSVALTRLMERKGVQRFAPAKRREMMQNLGYEYHPALKGGRMTTYSPIDLGKPRLYCKTDSPSFGLTEPQKVCEAYIQAQNISVTGKVNNHLRAL